MSKLPRTKSGRLYCRFCGSAAGMSRNVCSDCQVAEVRLHVSAQARVPAPLASGEHLHKGYRSALEAQHLSGNKLQQEKRNGR